MRNELADMPPAPLLLLALIAASEPAAPVTAEAIMARVAANQDRAQQLRASYIYRQRIVVRLRDSGGKLVREEDSRYDVTPTPDGTKKELAAFSGRYRAKKKPRSGDGMVPYDKSSFEAPDRRVDIDADHVKDLCDELVNDEKSRDGLAAGLFPLTTQQQQRYRFELAGEEDFRGVPVYRIKFAPRRREGGVDIDTTSGPWTGEALVTRDGAQPMLVTTRMARKVPVAIRTMLGSDLNGVGFSIRYEKFGEGVWFPVSFGTEFYGRLLFFYKRNVSISLENSGFRRADVSSTIQYADVK